MSEPTPATADRQVALRSIYVKDLSFESPNAPDIFRGDWRPETTLHLDIKVAPLGEDTHEVTLTVTVTARQGDKTAFLCEVQQAGIVSVSGFEQPELGPLFYVYCPSILFPYARQAVSDMVSRGGFPALLLQHVGFDGIYAQKLAEQQAAAAAPPVTH